MTNYTPVPFTQSGLLQKKIVEDAYELVKHSKRAIVSGAIMSEFFGDEEGVTAHLVAFTDPRMPLQEIENKFGEFAAHTVDKIRQIYDMQEKFPLRRGYSGIVMASFVACAIYDLDAFMAEWKDTPLNTPLMLTRQNGKDLVIEQTTLERQMRTVRRKFEDEYLPMAEYIGSAFSPEMEKRFKDSLRVLEAKLATPDVVLKPKKPGNSFPKP